MATTKRGIRYPYGEDYDLDADVPEDLKKMAESTDEAIDDVEKSLEEKLGTYANTYDSTKTYSIGSIVVYDKKIYECLEETTGKFDTTKWQEVTVKELIDKVEEITTEIVSEVEEEIKPSIEEVKQEISDIEEDQVTQNESIEELKTRVTELKEENEDLKNNQLTNTPEVATSHYLQDSADSRFRKFIPIGRTTQESTTGRNLVYNTLLPKTASGVTITYDASRDVYKLSGTATANANAYIIDYTVSIVSLNSNESIEFYIERVSGTKKVQFMCYFVPDDESAKDYTYYTILNENQTGIVRNVKTPNKSGKLAYVQFYLASGTTYNDEVRIMVSKTLNATYEPYTGGEPAPSPNYPQDIKNTGDNGSVNEKVQNKNLFDKTKATNGYINFNDGSFTASEQYTSSDYIQIEEGQQYYSNYLTFSSSSFGLAFYNKNKKYIRGSQLINKITVPDNAEYIRFCVRNSNYSSGTYITDINTLYFVKGNSPTDYVPHAEQNISFPLAEGQKFYEGSYPDDDDEKVHHKMSERVFDGSDDESWSLQSINSNGIANFAIGLADYSGRDENLSLCDYFSSQSTPIAQTTNEGYYLTISKTLYIRIKSTTASTVAELRTWLSNHNMKFQYELAEEQTEDFTEEQKTAWEEIKALRTYKNITHISSEDETPANVDITYVRDLETVINNLTTRVETIESEV